jgi:hypothetical protein
MTNLEIPVKISCVTQPIFFFPKLMISERHGVGIFYTEFTKITHDMWKIGLEIYFIFK